MNNNFIEMIEPTPKLLTKRCKIFALLLRLFLQFGIYLATVVAWVLYDYFVAIATLMASFVVMGIIRSKLRNSSIPLKQIEYNYTDQGIATWYVAKHICYVE